MARNDHEAVWAAIDECAKRLSLTPSGLANKCGLDLSAFNKSKRTVNGKGRWPSTQTVSTILSSCGISWEEFGRIVDERRAK